MKRFGEHAAAGRKCVLLYCGDFDPAGLLISTALRNNMKELEGAVNLELAQDDIPDINIDDVVIERFGLNYDFINENRLSWIDGLATGSGKRLDDITHKDHKKPYVQNYLKEYCPGWVAPLTPFTVGTGARKCEANALVVQPRRPGSSAWKRSSNICIVAIRLAIGTPSRSPVRSCGGRS